MSLFNDVAYVACLNLPDGCSYSDLPGNTGGDKKQDEIIRELDNAIERHFSGEEFEAVIEKFYDEIVERIYERIEFAADVNFLYEIKEAIEYFEDEV